jgi:hypothetical protein
LLKDLKDEGKAKPKSKGKDNESDDDDHLYQLIRGVPSVIVKAKETAFDDFVPMREAKFNDQDVKGIGKGGKRKDTVFTVTLMMTNQRGDKDEEYTPSRRNAPSSGNSKNETDKVKKGSSY